MEFEDGAILGQTLSEVHFQDRSKVNSQLVFRTFRGTIENSSMSFEINNDNWLLSTTAKLSKDGSKLLGTTKVTQADGKRSFSYSWSAVKSN